METKALIETLVITVMAALLGLSMPLIMQTIEHLDAKYGSGVISSAFRKDWRYRCYFWMVWIAILCMLWLPWAPEPIEYLQDSCFINNSAHILAWTSLSVTLILLLIVFRRIMKYESPERLLKLVTGISPDFPGGSDSRISALVDKENEFNQFGTLMKYSMKVGNTPLFLSCNQVLGSCIGECRKNKKDGTPVTYPNSVYSLINEALRISQRFADELLYPSLNNPQEFLSGYFDGLGKTTLSDVTLRQLWMNLSQLLKSDKPEWIKGYWVYATQYADYTVSNRIVTPLRLFEIEQADKANNDLSDFKEDIIGEWNCVKAFRNEAASIRLFHHMFSSYLLFLGKYSLVKWTFSYTPSSLRTLFLIPRNISEIVKELSYIYDNPILLETNYSFFNEQGIGSGDMMREWLLRYYILGLLDQSQMFAEDVTRHDPWNGEELYYNDNVILAQQYIRIINDLNICINRGGYYFYSLGIPSDNLQVISNKLADQVKNIEKKVEIVTANSHIEEKDVDRANRIIKEGISTIIQNLNEEPPTSKNLPEKLPISISVQSSRKDFVYDKDNFCQNAVPGILSMLHRVAMMKYINTFRFSSSIKNINIDYQDIADALNRLELKEDGKYIALPIDVTINSSIEGVCAKPLRGSTQSQILILDKSDLPSVEILIPASPILTVEEKDDIIILNAKLEIAITRPLKLSFLRLIIVNSLFDGNKNELSAIKPVETYFQSSSGE